MKKLFFILSMLATPFSLHAAAPLGQELGDHPKTMGIKAEIFPLLMGLADVEFNVRMQDRLSLAVALDAGVIYFPALLAKDIKAGASFGGGLGLKWHMTNTALSDGWYLKPMLRLAYSSLFSSKNHLGLIPTVEAGYDWFWKNGLWLSLGLAAHLPIALGPLKDSDSALFAPFPIPFINFGVGYSW